MNLVDSCGWLEYFAGGRNAGFFAPAIEKTADLIVPTLCLYEVFKCLLRQRGENAAITAVAAMHQGRVIEIDETIALAAARISHALQCPMADSMIVATAELHNATVWTQDAHFEKLPGVRYRAAR